MASPAEVANLLPETLPEDFSQWDSEDSPPALPDYWGSFKSPSGSGADSIPPAQFAEPRSTMAPKADELSNEPPPLPPRAYPDHEALGGSLRAIGAALKSEPIPVSQGQEPACAMNDVFFPLDRTSGAAVDRLRNAPPFLPPRACAEEEAFFHQLQAICSGSDTRPNRPSLRSVLARATDEVSFKLVPGNGASERRWREKAIHVTETNSVAEAVAIPSFQSDLDEVGDQNPIRKKWLNVAVIGIVSILLIAFFGVRLLSAGRPALAKQPFAPHPVSANADPATYIRKPSPSTPQIPQDIKVKVKEEAPLSGGSSVASKGDGGDASATGGVLSDPSQPKDTNAPSPVPIISAEAANGLLLLKTQPAYPPAAWYGGITSKVVVQATVSSTGAVEHLHVVSGPQMFRQATLDAVKTWRYKPYTVDDEPSAFQTTVEVFFDESSGGNSLSVRDFGSHSISASTDVKGPGAGTQ